MSMIRFQFPFRIHVLSATLAFGLLACAKPQYLSSPEAGPRKSGSGCIATFKTQNACVDLKWEKFPTETEFGSFIFSVSDASQILMEAPATDNSVLPKVVLWMPSMGHGSSPVTVERLATGLYRANRVFFTMKGDWEIRFQTASDQATYALDF